MGRNKRQDLGPRIKRMNRQQRLVSAREWLASFHGKRLLRAYRRRYGVDVECALTELEMLGVALDPTWVEQVRRGERARIEARQRRRRERRKKAEPPGWPSDEYHAFIVGYTSGGAAFGVTWEQWERLHGEVDPEAEERSAFPADPEESSLELTMTRRYLSQDTIPLPQFKAQLRQLLETLSHDEIVECLVEAAAILNPRQRTSFLAILLAGPEDEARGAVAPFTEEALVEALGEFEEDLHRGVLAGPGWGDGAWMDEEAEGELDGELAAGPGVPEREDESWTSRLDWLFGWANRVYVAGDMELALEAYERLFWLFEQSWDMEPSFTVEPPERRLETDLPEARARYLRALYEVTPPEDRASELFTAVRETAWLLDYSTGLEALEAAREEPLLGFREFLDDWTRLLRESLEEDSEDLLWLPQRNRLLLEAVERRDGLAGLARLARQVGASGLYDEWARAAARRGEYAEAMEALGEGLREVELTAERSLLAAHLASLASATGQGELALCCRRLAWRLRPTSWNLGQLVLAAHDAAGREGNLEELFREEQELMGVGPFVPDRLIGGMVEVLAGDLEVLARRLELPEEEDESASDIGDDGLLAVLLVAGAEVGPPPAGSMLSDVWYNIDREADPSGFFGIYHLLDGLDGDWIEEAVGAPVAVPPKPSDLAVEALQDRSLSPARRSALLEAGHKVVRQRVSRMLATQGRRAHERAAALATICAEALTLAGRAEEGEQLLDELQAVSPRRKAFRRSVAGYQQSSSVLGR